MKYYKHHRYPTYLFGLTTLEVVNGKTPDKNLFKDKIQQTKKKQSNPKPTIQ